MSILKEKALSQSAQAVKRIIERQLDQLEAGISYPEDLRIVADTPLNALRVMTFAAIALLEEIEKSGRIVSEDLRVELNVCTQENVASLSIAKHPGNIKVGTTKPSKQNTH